MSNKKTLVLGASLKPERYSNAAINKLKANNHEVLAFGLVPGRVNSVSIDTELLDYTDIHTVTLYLNSNHQKKYYKYILGLNPRRVIFNPGTENPEFMELLSAQNISYEVACTLVLLSIGEY